MRLRRESVFNAEANRWNIGKLVVGVACAFCLCDAMLAAGVVLGLGSVPNAFPHLNASPLRHLIHYGALAIALAFVFRSLERGRRAMSR